MLRNVRIQPTHLEFQDTHTPFSPLFDDVYFLPEKGVEESTYVYLEGTQLHECIASGHSHIQLAEIGFGVGLNFLLTLLEFKKAASPFQRMTYFSAERYPVFESDLRELYSRFPELEPAALELLDQYPVLVPGFHTLSFCEGRFKLVLMLGDASEMLSRLDAKINLWYWDGFAPNKNPDTFSEILFKQVSRLSAPGACGASFTSAGWVRRGLASVGFDIEKRKGFHHKRECIRAHFKPKMPIRSFASPWFSNENLKLLMPGQTIAVVGAGLSGSAIARTLAERGFASTVFDPNGIAQKASGNSAGLYNLQVSKLPNPISRFSQLALTHFIRELKKLTIAHHSGIFRVSENLKTALETSEYPQSFFEEKTVDGQDGYYFSHCGIIHPPELCNLRLSHPLIRFIKEAATETNLSEFDHVVYCVGADLHLGDQLLKRNELAELPLRPIRGQTIEVEPSLESSALAITLVKDGYITPVDERVTRSKYHLLGATYQAKEIKPNQVELDNEKLVNDAALNWPLFKALLPGSIVSSRVGFRQSTPDKLPMIGPLFDRAWVNQHYGRAFKGSTPENLASLEVIPGQWIMLGMGSRGITFSSLSAELLASLMTGDPVAIESDLWEHLHSVRFSIRNLKRNEVT